MNELVVVSHVVMPARPAQSVEVVQIRLHTAVEVLFGTHIAPATQSTFTVQVVPGGNVPARWQLV